MNLEHWRDAMFALCWHQHGGSGLAMTYTDALELSLADRDWLLERVQAQRAREAQQLERAGKRK